MRRLGIVSVGLALVVATALSLPLARIHASSVDTPTATPTGTPTAKPTDTPFPAFTPTPTPASTSCVPSLVSPEQGALLDNGRTDRLDDIVWDFDWSDCEGASRYHLYVRYPGARAPVVDNADVPVSSYHLAEPGAYIGDLGRFGWTWRVRAMVGSEWGEWSETRTFDAEPVNTDPPLPAAAQAQADWCDKLQKWVDDFNRGEIDLDDHADDVVFDGLPPCGECVGKDAYRNYLEFLVAVDTQLTVASCQVSGNTIALTYEMRGRGVQAAGVDRIILFSAMEFDDDTVLSNRNVGADMEDPQTAQFFTWLYGPAFLTFKMGPGRDADQSPGAAAMERSPDFSAVGVRIAPGPAGVPQPVNIHTGTCAELGPVAFALKDMADGVSYTALEGVAGSDLQTGNYAIAVQRSAADPDVFVSCGDIPAAAAEVPLVEPAPAPEEAPPAAPAPAALPSGGSGGLLGEGDSSLPTWWYALFGAGVLLFVCGVAAARRA